MSENDPLVVEDRDDLELAAESVDVVCDARAYAEHPGFLTLVCDGDRLIGAYGLGPEAGEWMQQATLATRAGVSIEVMKDTIQPFPTFSEIFYFALAKLSKHAPPAVA